MDIEIKAWLYDILNAVIEIESFIEDLPEEFNAYQNDLKTRRAIERNLEIIGEALNRILKKSISVSITNARKIVDTRNRIVHGYDSLSDEMIWSIVLYEIPILKHEVSLLLAE
jgi:uncharacterized protein with HEPN domain